jgi:CubicO group peptidase (beta-lactamase class C family)
LVDTGHLPGVTTMLVRHGKVVNYEVHGKKGFDGPPMTKDTVFRIYSQTKPVTGVAMMILFEEGKWKLDDPVTKFVPEFASCASSRASMPTARSTPCRPIVRRPCARS